jgi:hypothetical protein
MEARIDCLVLKDNTVLISQVVEVDAELGDPNCKLIQPFEIKKQNDSDYRLIKWMSDFTDQTTFLINSDNILTIIDPKKEYLKSYVDLIS